jgi:hypothetical protein
MFGIENSANNFGRSAGLLSNTIANLPIRAALGTLYITSDTLEILRWDGSGWVLIGGGGSVFGGATNGLQNIGTLVGLGGTLTTNTQIICDNFLIKFDNYSQFAIGNNTEPSMLFDTSNQKISTSFNGTIKGLELNFANNQYFLGNQELLINGASGVLDFNFGGIGLQMTNFGRICNLGDVVGGFNATLLSVDDINEEIITNNQGFANGIEIDFVNNVYNFGDFGNVTNGTYIQIENAQQEIKTWHTGINRGLLLDFANLKYILGDCGLIGNGYAVTLDDGVGELRFDGANLQSNSAGGNSGEHLVIWVNGTNYKIKLENP